MKNAIRNVNIVLNRKETLNFRNFMKGKKHLEARNCRKKGECC